MLRGFSVLGAAVLVVALAPLATAGQPRAELIDVHEIKVADHGKGNGGKGGGGGKPVRAANCVNDDSSQYANTVVPTGWLVQGNKAAYLNTATIPSGLGGVTSAMQASFNAWSGAGVPSVNVTTSGTATRETANHRYDLLFGRTPGGSIAVTYTWRWTSGEIESDVIFNSRLAWYQSSVSPTDGCDEGAGSTYDLANIATHEFGHVYGLDHPSGARYETMYAYGYTGETLKRTPTPGEKSGLVDLYA